MVHHIRLLPLLVLLIMLPNTRPIKLLWEFVLSSTFTGIYGVGLRGEKDIPSLVPVPSLKSSQGWHPPPQQLTSSVTITAGFNYPGSDLWYCALTASLDTFK
ncbi:hypothetical protein AV530_016957 [Patagioenas fasciata monilis]|uniref:Secreted protein n=1 Tax=Patagioenas fasciata monilis TaxID=372326 RepID=A0A1V4J4A4_PATFA|nr:hypothetical protein AV530_016957 [Patagioenas fasciata monilis]